MHGFIERVIIPSVVVFVLLGGLGGVLLGAALVMRSAAALRFVARMNRWVSARPALQPLEKPYTLEPPSPRLRRWLGACLALGGACAVGLLLWRLRIDRSFVPGVNVQRWVLSGIALEWMKWSLVVGSAISCALGVLMVFFPRRIEAFEARMDRWHSAPRLRAAEETMYTPLEPRVEANPRAAGALIAGASLLVALGMIALMLAKLR